MDELNYAPHYSNSRALIIGIDKYSTVSPLQYAVKDARAVRKILKSRFDFPEDSIRILINKDATRSKIMDSYMTFANRDCEKDDRILFFFAGHGHTQTTQTGRRGEVGFLVPYDGDVNNLSSLIRWDDLTKNAELILAKHILYVMDACYGGLAITRALPPGSMRFLKDMLQRYSWQVLTAGKANEIVSDSGGPIPNHSVFTGHFIQGLEGKAENEDGVITANGVMSYVYEKVAKDPHSQQTPHYGYLGGDGDFIFNASTPILSKLTDEDDINKDILVSVPSSLSDSSSVEKINLIRTTKEYLSDRKYKIKLDDLVNQKLREVISLLSDEKFLLHGGSSSEGFSKKLKLYEHVVKDVQSIISCTVFWGDNEHYQMINKIFARISDTIKPQGGLVVDIYIRWYPLFLLLYSAGIASIAADKYFALSSILTAKARSPNNIYGTVPISIPIGKAAAELHNAFKTLPGHEKYYVPRSEYLYKLLQPDLDDLLFLGNDYERHFDRLEIFLALVYVDFKYKPEDSVWGPPGRFAYKYRGRDSREGNAFLEILEEAERQKDNWPPLKANLFSGSYERFIKIAKIFQEEILNNLQWF